MQSIQSTGEKRVQALIMGLLALVALATLYPFWYVLIVSISNSDEIMKGSTMLIPRGINVDAYKAVFVYPFIWTSYVNTIFYTVVGTFISVTLTLFAAYPLSRRKFVCKKFFLIIITFTMFFSGGLIPTYLVVKDLNLIDTRWSMLLPGAIITWNFVILRTFLLSIPDSLEESAKIDGASDYKVLFSIILPLSKAGIAITALYYAVGQWNSFFSALIYLNDKKLYPLQIILTQIVLQNDTTRNADTMQEIRQGLSLGIRYAAIIVAVVPILAVYPFIQKYFVKGVMLGSVKG